MYNMSVGQWGGGLAPKGYRHMMAQERDWAKIAIETDVQDAGEGSIGRTTTPHQYDDQMSDIIHIPV